MVSLDSLLIKELKKYVLMRLNIMIIMTIIKMIMILL